MIQNYVFIIIVKCMFLMGNAFLCLIVDICVSFKRTLFTTLFKTSFMIIYNVTRKLLPSLFMRMSFVLYTTCLLLLLYSSFGLYSEYEVV